MAVKKESDWLAALDDVRAIAIALVVAMHGYSAFFKRPSEITNPFLVFIYGGGAGVGLFFVLSGYLVSRPFIRSLVHAKPVSTHDYFIQRSLRILPLYFVFVMLAATYTGAWEKVPAALLFLLDGAEMGSFSHVWWSLAVEVHFYILVPFLFLLFLHRKWMILCSMLLAYVVFSLAFAFDFVVESEESRAWVGHSIFGNFHAFFVGGLVCYLRERFDFQISRKIAVLMLLVLVLLMWETLYVRATLAKLVYSQRPLSIFVESLLWGMFVAVMVAARLSFLGAVGRFLARTSYSIYLCHLPVILFFVVHMKFKTAGFPHEPSIALPVAVLTTLFVSFVCYTLVEKPALKLKDAIRIRKQPSTHGA